MCERSLALPSGAIPSDIIDVVFRNAAERLLDHTALRQMTVKLIRPAPCPSPLAGISSHVRPSSSRPVRLLTVPPHCLKKNGTLARTHWSRTSATQQEAI